MASVSISSARKSETINLNGGMSVGEALAHFFRTDVRSVESQVAGQSVRLNEAGVDIPAGLATPLRDRDFVTIYASEIARGGVKGAARP